MVPIALVVDDSMLIRHTVCRYLEELGCRVESATNGEEALDMLRDLHPHIIITDIEMPKMDGYQLVKRLKNQPQTSAIPIVILAAATSRADKSIGGEADFVVFKDIDIENQLLQVLKKSLLLSNGITEDSSQG